MRPQRLPFAAGDGLTRYAPGSPVALRIDSPYRSPGGSWCEEEKFLPLFCKMEPPLFRLSQ